MNEETRRVLVADDEMVMRLFIVSILKKMGCEVVGEAVNGEEAVAMFREMNPDLLLMDINMPVKGGEAALGEIIAEFPNARIIMLTSVVDAETVGKCIDAGAAGYIRKDSSIDEIQAIIDKALDRSG